MVQIPTKFANVTHTIPFFVSSSLPYECLVGLNFCYNFHINFAFDNHGIKVSVPPDHESSKFFNTSPTIVPSMSSTVIELSNDSFEHGDVIIDPDDTNLGRLQCFLHSSLCNVTDYKTNIVISNPTYAPVMIPAKMNIATLSMDNHHDLSHHPKQETNYNNKRSKAKINDFNINPNLGKEDQNKIKSVLDEFNHLFATDMAHLTQTNIIEHRIDLIDESKTIFTRPYRMSPRETEILQEKINAMEKNGIVEPSLSPYCSPTILIRKPGGQNDHTGFRLVNNYRLLNSNTVKDRYNLPRIDDCLLQIADSTIFSTLDLYNGFYGIKLREEDRIKTAFMVGGALYHYVVMPQGLCNSPSTFCRAMARVLRDIPKNTVVNYIDDLLICGKNIDTHVHNLRLVLSAIDKYNFRIQLKKCSFGNDTIKFLGFKISGHGIAPDDEKIRAVLELPIPKNVQQVQAFLGCTSYYRTYIKSHSIIAAPLYALTKKGVKFQWSASCQEAFEKLKFVLSQPPLLSVFREDHPVELHTDASRDGLGCVCTQRINGKEHVLGYYSRSLNKHEKNYPISELECAAVIFGIRKNRHLIYLRKFTVITDHKSLKWLFTISDPTGRLCRWQLMLQDYDFEIIHRDGKKHQNSDMLSRLPLPDTLDPAYDCDLDDKMVLTVTAAQVDFSSQLNDIRQQQKNDSMCSKIRQNMGTNNQSLYVIEDDILYRMYSDDDGLKQLIVLPQQLAQKIISLFHDHAISGHFGALKTYHRMKNRFFHPKLLKLVTDFIKTCPECQLRKPRNHLKPGIQGTLPIGDKPFSCIYSDLIGPLPETANGNKYILVVTDSLTKFVVTEAIPNKRTNTVAHAILERVYYVYGIPEIFISDQGKEYISSLWNRINHTLSVDQRRTTAYHPCANGQTEVTNRSLATAISMYIQNDQELWDQWLQPITFAVNTSYHSATKTTPYKLLFGTDPPEISDHVLGTEDKSVGLHKKMINQIREKARQNIQQSQERNRERSKAKLQSMEFSPGQKVSIYRPVVQPGNVKKFSYPFVGPMTVKRKLPGNDATYEVIDNRRPGKERIIVVNLSNMRLFHERETTRVEDSNKNDRQTFYKIDIPIESTNRTDQPNDNDDDLNQSNSNDSFITAASAAPSRASTSPEGSENEWNDSDTLIQHNDDIGSEPPSPQASPSHEPPVPTPRRYPKRTCHEPDRLTY